MTGSQIGVRDDFDPQAVIAENAIGAVAGGGTLARENSVMARMRVKLWRANISHKFHYARLRLLLIAVLSVLFWFGLYILFTEGLKFISNIVGDDAKPGIFNAYFSALMLMLTMSSGLILYSGLYRAEEMRFLYSLPLSGETLFTHKLQEAVWFGGWGFILTSTPMLVASGVNVNAPWYYYPLMLPFLISFMYIPATIGALGCVLIVSWMPRHRLRLLWIVLAILLVLMIWIAWSALDIDRRSAFTTGWYKVLGDKLRYSQQRFLPSYWLSTGLLEAESRRANDEGGYQPWAECLMFLAVLVSNALLCHLLAIRWGGARLRTSFQRHQAEYFGRKTPTSSLISINGPWTFGRRWLPCTNTIRLLMLKELRIFCRDPVQWLQFAIFTGLLAFYLANLNRLQPGSEQSTMIGFLNLAIVGLILSTFTTRFIYPMVSLEGKRFWIMNLLPIDRGSILYAKFLFAAIGSWIPCAGLIYFSDFMLEIPIWMTVMHQVTVVELCFGLAGMAVGLGAMMPDMREEAPAKIAAGFGGTLNLVLSALYILVLVLLTAVPGQLRVLESKGLLALTQSSSVEWLERLGTVEALWIAQGINFLLAVAASWGLLTMGVKMFRRQGF